MLLLQAAKSNFEIIMEFAQAALWPLLISVLMLVFRRHFRELIAKIQVIKIGKFTIETQHEKELDELDKLSDDVNMETKQIIETNTNQSIIDQQRFTEERVEPQQQTLEPEFSIEPDTLKKLFDKYPNLALQGIIWQIKVLLVTKAEKTLGTIPQNYDLAKLVEDMYQENLFTYKQKKLVKGFIKFLDGILNESLLAANINKDKIFDIAYKTYKLVINL